MLFDYVIIDIIYVVAFLLLVLAYFVEIRGKSVKLNIVQKCVITCSFALPLLYSVYQYVNAPFDLYLYFGLSPLINYILIYLSIGLVTIIVTLMVSFYQAKGNGNTLAGMTGILLILSGFAIPAVFIALNAAYLQALSSIFSIVGLGGYSMFLGTVIHEKMAKGGKQSFHRQGHPE
jgi:hypothetical protein